MLGFIKRLIGPSKPPPFDLEKAVGNYLLNRIQSRGAAIYDFEYAAPLNRARGSVMFYCDIQERSGWAPLKWQSRAWTKTGKFFSSSIGTFASVKGFSPPSGVLSH